MADDRRRLQSPTERELASEARRKTAPRGMPAVPVESWHEEKTGVGTDPQVFHAVKELGKELQAYKIEAARAHGALSAEVVALKQDIGDVKSSLDENTRLTERAIGRLDVMLADRRSGSPSSQQRTLTVAVKETLADKVLTEQAQRNDFHRKLWLQIAGGVFSGAVLAALITLVATGKC